MDIMGKMDEQFENVISSLTEKEQMWLRNFKLNMFNIYNQYIKPILIAIFMFWLFTRIKNTLGIEEATYIALVVILIFLRNISSKIH